MALKQVELIRSRIVRGFMGELARIRQFISGTDNQVAVDKLRGEAGDLVLARMTEKLLSELGHETTTSVEAKASHVRRPISRVRGKSRGARAAAAIKRDLAQDTPE